MRSVLIKGPGVGQDDVAGTAVSRTEGRFVLSKAEAQEIVYGIVYLHILHVVNNEASWVHHRT